MQTAHILLINGSPKGKRSNSLRLATSFVAGLRAQLESQGCAPIVDELHLAELNIAPCRGCFACWKSTPGTCCIKDDMQMVMQKEIGADYIIWSFPLYYFNVPGILKNMIDRQLPVNLPFMSANKDDYGSGSHDTRYDMTGTKHVLVSTCGFYSAEGNYDSVRMMFKHFLGKDSYAEIFCGQGELFRIKELSERTESYLALVSKAGQEFARGGIAEETKLSLKELLYPKESFEAMADASWGISKDGAGKLPEDEIFTRQMAALYNKDAYDGKDRVLEMRYTDVKRSYQILLGKDGSSVVTDGSHTATTIIETPYSLWSSISRGEIEGAEALGKKLYHVSGDFDLMMRWSTFFGAGSARGGNGSGAQAASAAQEQDAKPQKKASMTTMLIPWICFWIAVAIHPVTGALITLGVCALLPLVMGSRPFVIWDRLSIALVAALSIAAYGSGNSDYTTTAGYLLFGLLWLGSCLVKEPLCATYVKYDFGGNQALRNPLFMKTNYILAACWGILYILTATWTFLLKRAGAGISVTIINNLVPVLMGIFTGWFQKWYPARLAR